MWANHVYKGRRGSTYSVKWGVAGSRHQRTFATRKLTDSFRSGLITAARSGVQLSASDGLPASMRMNQTERTWYAHAWAFIDMKWAHASPSHRRGLAEALIWVTTAMVTNSRDTPDNDALRKALYHWSFNVTARGHRPIDEADIPSDFAQEVAWIARRPLSLRSFASPSTVRRAMRSTYPALEAHFACLYYAARRPAEARHLRVKDCVLPDSGWGELVLLGSTPDAGGAWTDSGQANEDRQLKHRGVSDTRPVPASPELVEILRRHIATFPASPDGRLFVTRIGRAGVPLPAPFTKPLRMGTAYRVWTAARAAAFTGAEYASPLAKRPYDLRHAAVSTWLNAGVNRPRSPSGPGTA